MPDAVYGGGAVRGSSAERGSGGLDCERKTLLSMFFFLLALGAYRWYAQKPTDRRYVVVALLFALGLTAKAQVITLPFVLLLWDYWPLQRMFPPPPDKPADPFAPAAFAPQKFSKLVWEKVPLLALCAIDALLTVYSEHDARPKLWPPLTQRLGNAIYSYSQYLKKAFWPASMAPLYPNPGSSLTMWEIAGELCSSSSPSARSFTHSGGGAISPWAGFGSWARWFRCWKLCSSAKKAWPTVLLIRR